MTLIDKDALVAKIDDWRDKIDKGILVIPLEGHQRADAAFEYEILGRVRDFLDTLEVIDPYEQWIQHSSIEEGIKAHAEDYSFNIESELFQQLNKEQQELWRKEIEQACMSGGYCGLNLGLDKRYDKEGPVSIWHDANQQPTMYRKYLVRYSDGTVSGSWERHDDGFISWKDVVKEHKFTHWCYTEDLLKL